MKRGHNSPSSNDNTVPETAPTAKRIAAPLAHRCARILYVSSPVRIHSNSATTIINGRATPMAAKTM